MIYQENGEFKIFTKKASYDNKIEFISNIDEFEKMLKNSITSINNESIIPDIVYTDVCLTSEQSKRFEKIKNAPGINLDEITNYVMNNKETQSIAFELFKLKCDNADLWFEIMTGGEK